MKFLNKFYPWKTQKNAKYLISHLKLVNGILMFSQIIFCQSLTAQSRNLNSLKFPVFKKTRKKEDYILVRTLQNTLNIADKSLFHRVSNSMESYLSKQQYSFRKGYSTQNCLQVMLEKWRAIFEKRKCFGDVQRRFNALLIIHIFTWLIFMISDTDYASLTVGNTPYVIWKDITEITLPLEDNSLKFF